MNDRWPNPTYHLFAPELAGLLQRCVDTRSIWGATLRNSDEIREEPHLAEGIDRGWLHLVALPEHLTSNGPVFDITPSGKAALSAWQDYFNSACDDHVGAWAERTPSIGDLLRAGHTVAV